MKHNKLIGIILLCLLGVFSITALHAETAPRAVPPVPHKPHKKGYSSETNSPRPYDVEIKTPYGVVQYYRYGARLAVNGRVIFDDQEQSGVDVLFNKGNFRLSDEEVIVFEGANTGSGGLTGETFFLILRPNKYPEIVNALIDPLSNPIKETWQEKDVIYVDFEVGDYDPISSPLKLVSGKVILDKATPALYSKTGPRLKDEDCSNLYRIASQDCPQESNSSQQNCADVVRDAGGVGKDSLADAGTFRFLSGLPGFNGQNFEASCLAMCKGTDVAYGKFSMDVCNIK